VFAGLALGLLGLALLLGPEALHGGGSTSLIGTGVLMVAALCWALGSLYTKGAPKPATGSIGSGTQMLAGGVCLLVVALLMGELPQLDLAHVSTRSLLGFAYLISFGSLIGFTAYIYLLGHTTAAKAATYAYVNPVVAVLLGWAFANEPINARMLVAAAVILGGVAVITVTRDAGVTSSSPNGRRAAA
jgi:drug/metabolite transporter (DMT)-like permease